MTALPDLLTATVEDLANGLDARLFTSVQLTLAYIARIQEINPVLRAVLEVNAYAVLDALRRDQERAEGKVRSILHGLPIVRTFVICYIKFTDHAFQLVKDSIASDRPE